MGFFHWSSFFILCGVYEVTAGNVHHLHFYLSAVAFYLLDTGDLEVSVSSPYCLWIKKILTNILCSCSLGEFDCCSHQVVSRDGTYTNWYYVSSIFETYENIVAQVRLFFVQVNFFFILQCC